MNYNLENYEKCHRQSLKQIVPEVVRLKEKPNTPLQGKRCKSKQGWVCVHIYGTPYMRGYAHGTLLQPELDTVQEIFPYLAKQDLGVSLNTFVKQCQKEIIPIVCVQYPEIYQELLGIADGYKAALKKLQKDKDKDKDKDKKADDFSVEKLIAWNSLLSMFTHYNPASREDRCSAFIACGDATEDGDLIMAHNSHSDYVFARVSNIILKITPKKGHAFIMQCCPGYVASGMDWFVTSQGIIGCETTIGGFLKKPEFKKGTPYFCRIRYAMQHGETIDDYAKIMREKNAGDYPCSWLFGDIHKKEIMLCEIGLDHTNIEKKKTGIFYGMNSAMDETLRKEETNDLTHWRTSTTSGARNVRFHKLLYETFQNKLNVQNAKQIISDHYDVFLDKNTQGNSRTLCKHSENDSKKTTGRPPRPFGAIDGKVINSAMAKKMSFVGIFGKSCGGSFHPKAFMRTHTRKQKNKFKRMTQHLRPIPSYKWVNIEIKSDK